MRKFVRSALALAVAACATTTIDVVDGTGGQRVAAASGDFTAITPTRLLDTRPGSTTVDGQHQGVGPIGPATVHVLPIGGRATIPATATAVAINITAVASTADTFITAYPTGADRPVASNLNPRPGRVIHNAAQLPLGDDGSIDLFNLAGSTELVIDVLGYFVGDSCFTGVTAARLLDTRAGGETVDGAGRPGRALGPASSLRLDVRGRGGVLDTARAVAVNITAVGATAGSYVTVYPGGVRPTASNLNPVPGSITHNMAQVPIAADGTIEIYNHAGSTDLLVDVLGFYDGTCFTAVTPARLLDTRPGESTADGDHRGAGAVSAGTSYVLPVRNRAGIPPAAVAVAINITAIGATEATFVTAYPGPALPTASNLNPAPGSITHNTTQIPIAGDGTIRLYQHAGSVHLVVDVLGWYSATDLVGPGGPEPGVHPRIYLPGAQQRLQSLLDAGAPSATRFRSYADARLSTSFGSLYDSDFRMWYFALLGNLTGDERYCRRAVDGIEWFVSGEEQRSIDYTSGQPGTGPRVGYDSYLEIGPLVGDVMMVYDWCHADVLPGQRARWLAYADRAVWNVWHPDAAEWAEKPAAWSGWSIDNPSNNYYYSFLRATMLLGLGAEGELASAVGWKDFFRETKIARQLIPTFDADLVGGGSREGTGYGTAMMRLWEVYDIWEQSTGENIARLTGHSRASLVHFLHSVVPTLDAVSLNGDHSRDSTGALFDYHRHYAQSLARVVGDDVLSGRVRALLDDSSVPTMQNGFMVVYDFLDDMTEIPAVPLAALDTAYRSAGAGQVYVRSDWTKSAAWLNLTAGPYTESHAHRDQGSFLLFKNRWMAIDPNFFSHSGIRQEEELHNLVRIAAADGSTVTQREGTASTVQALREQPTWFHAAADSTAVYSAAPGSPVQAVQREWLFIEPDVLVVFDRVTTSPGTTQRWQLNVPTRPTVTGPAATVTSAETTLHSQRIIPASAQTTVFDWTSDGDMTGGFRLDETVAGGANTFLHVLSFGDSVTTAVRSDADGRQGVAITLADGRQVTARFSTAGVDGTLLITAAGGSTVVSTPLSATVTALPELAG